MQSMSRSRTVTGQMRKARRKTHNVEAGELAQDGWRALQCTYESDNISTSGAKCVSASTAVRGKAS